MRARLICKYGKLEERTYRIGDEATIGRARGNAIRLEPAGISSQHARIRLDRGRDCYVLEDLGSLNGTQLDGLAVESPERLGHLHVISVAGYDFLFQDLVLCDRRHGRGERRPTVEAEATGVERAPAVLPRRLSDQVPRPEDEPESEAEPATEEEPSLHGTLEEGLVAIPAALRGADAGPQPSGIPLLVLEVELEPGRTTRHRLGEGRNRIGRADDVEVRIDRPEVSRWHAVMSIDGERVTLRDQGSANHTFVDEQKLEPEKEVEVEPGTPLRFGKVKARLVAE